MANWGWPCLGVVAQAADRALVMYAGRIVERAPVDALFARPAHPYTRALLASMPSIDMRVERLHTIEGQVPPLGSLPPGCRFAPRCGHRVAACDAAVPSLSALGDGRETACVRVVDGSLDG